MAKDYHFLKQVVFSQLTDVGFAQDNAFEAVKQFISVGDNVHVKKGKCIWKNIRVVSLCGGSLVGKFYGRTTHGKEKVHTFNVMDIII